MKDIFKPFSFYKKTKMIDLSLDQIKRRRKKIDDDNIVKLLPNERNILEWHLNYSYINLFKRIRNKKSSDEVRDKINSEKHYQSIKFEYESKGDNNYTTEISVNFKDDYDSSYYRHFAVQLFYRYQKNLYYAIERDLDGYVHVHIGSCGECSELMLVCDYITKEVFNQQNDVFIDFLRGEIQTNIHISPIMVEEAYIKYLKKGDDSLGNAQLYFLNF